MKFLKFASIFMASIMILAMVSESEAEEMKESYAGKVLGGVHELLQMTDDGKAIYVEIKRL